MSKQALQKLTFWNKSLCLGYEIVVVVVVVCVWQDWALGVLHAKIIAAITLMGPQWWLKNVIEQVSLTSYLPLCMILKYMSTL